MKNQKPQEATLLAMALGALPPLVACVLVLGGCASASYPLLPEAQANVARDNPPPPKDEDFPKLSTAKWEQGAFPSLEALRAMRTGMGKDQVRELLSWPHFTEGLGGVREWNYIFHFRTGKGPEYVTCQYMVRYNKDVLTSGMYWKNPECAALVNPPEAKPIPVVVAPAPAPAQKVTLGADGLFRFDGGAVSDLLPEGRAKVERLAVEIQRNAKQLQGIVVTGHTDRLGSESYNAALSLARANSVRELLAQNGIDRRLIRTQGMGERQPVAQCQGTAKTPALVSCLQPNRRVEIEVVDGRQ
ncbi:OmpA family protein [Variovorax sp. J22G21]|uniref:OmpA family protein n=1 Tax=Variovorax fucosicus TaxID=3053517 RepID=UPI0025774C8C|nr:MULTISPECIES: OmpA family protein [unclassified Variovorax]MDM0039020.1 OmpA family protein [Variovorax sp. J22R193]MDM0063796.1 OmpA family protein [Variovorax sp. J22G21]